MSDHLPECPAGYVADLCTTDIDPVLQEPSCNHCVGQGCICICNRLRACEQRLLDAAREAITNLPVAISSYYPDDSLRDVGFWRSSALAAIDALREKP